MTISKKGNLVEKAYDALKKKILCMEFKPGDYLNEKALMEELGIGRTPLRQAIILRPGQCLFCRHEEATIERNVRHMEKIHSFGVPDREFLMLPSGNKNSR